MLLGGRRASANELAGYYYVPDFRVFTLGITYWASKRVRSRNDYTPQAAISPVFRTGWRLPGTNVRRLILGDLRAGVYLRL